MQVYPLKFKPIYKSRIWGGQKLRDLFDKDIPAGEKIGESWELADLPRDKSVIINGQFQGRTLAEVVAKFPKEITGDANFTGQFPLLIKFLDAQDILSVQVHPDGDTCRRMGTGQPKTECWYIIAAEKDAIIYKGLKEGVTKEQFARAIENGTTAELLAKVPVRAGECHFLPAGTAHAIGAGLLIAEIQTPSDTTYRVFDWNRVDKNGKSRQLHIEQALESIGFDSSGENLSVTRAGRLVDCEYFRIDKCEQSAGSDVVLSAGQMKTLIFLSGKGAIQRADDFTVELGAGDCILSPADCEGVMEFSADTEYLVVTI